MEFDRENTAFWSETLVSHVRPAQPPPFLMKSFPWR
jgi:hypothetical protein